jgi:hypothetical protein
VVFAEHPTLTHLNLAHNDMGAQSAIAIGSLLARNISLTVLNLRNNSGTVYIVYPQYYLY